MVGQRIFFVKDDGVWKPNEINTKAILNATSMYPMLWVRGTTKDQLGGYADGLLGWKTTLRVRKEYDSDVLIIPVASRMIDEEGSDVR